MTTWTREALNKSQEMADEIVPDQGNLEARLQEYVDSRDIKGNLERHMANLGQLFKYWLERNPEEELYDGEHGIVARLQERKVPGRDADLNRLYDNDRELFEMLVRNGCLKVDEQAIKRAGALVGGVERYLSPERRTTALVVEKK